MQYVLAIGILAKIYKSPTIRISLNDTLIDETNLDQDIVEKKMDFTLFHSQLDNKKLFTTTLVEKFFIYHLDSNSLSDVNYLKLSISGCLSNNTNGFMSKSDQYMFRSIWFAPKKFFFKSKENFFKDFQNGFLEKNSFTWDNNDTGFYNTKTKNTKQFIPGWPLPYFCEQTKESFLDQMSYYNGADKKIVYKIIKKYGIYQFENDIDSVGMSPKTLSKTSSASWVSYMETEGKKIWPIDTRFLCFCYHNKDNKYLHEDQ